MPAATMSQPMTDSPLASERDAFIGGDESIGRADLEAATWKASCYAWLEGPRAGNDLDDHRYSLDATELALFTALRSAPAGLAALSSAEPRATVRAALGRLVDRQLVVPADTDEGRRFSVRRVDIETSSHCNARCGFCPQSLEPRPRHLMTEEFFERVLGELAPFRPDWVAFNHFSEPLLDPLFRSRCESLLRHGLKLALFTNGTALRPAVSRWLAESGVLFRAAVNFPSADPADWGELMGLPPSAYARTERNAVALAEAYRGDLQIVVNSRAGDQGGRAARVAALFAPYSHAVIVALASHTLAGHIENERVGPACRREGPRLFGCTHARPAGHVHISSRGEVYLCSMDYDQKSKFGSLDRSSLVEILNGPAAARYRRQVYGLEDAAPDLICRKCWNSRVA